MTHLSIIIARAANGVIGDRTQWIMRNIARHGAVVVILGDDDVGRLIPAKLAELFEETSGQDRKRAA